MVLLVCGGLAYQAIGSYLDLHRNPPAGQFVDVGGYKLYLNCVGQGSPTVVLDSGLGDYWAMWYKVQAQIGHETRVCSYDRAGLGFSDPSPLPRTSKVIAQELHTLLQNAGVGGPYILVGHSFGGFNVRMFANSYPKEVAGVVLVDATHPERMRRAPAEANSGFYKARFQQEMVLYTMPFGVPRLLRWCGADLPQEEAAVERALDCSVKSSEGWLAEYQAFNESASEVDALNDLGATPLIVLSRDPEKRQQSTRKPTAKNRVNAAEASLARLQEELLHLSADSRQIIAKGSDHYIQLDRPDIVISAVHQLLCKCESGGIETAALGGN